MMMIPKPQLTRKPWHATTCLHTGEASLSLQESRGMPQHVYIRRGKPQLQQLIFIQQQAMPVWDVGLMRMMRMMMMVIRQELILTQT